MSGGTAMRWTAVVALSVACLALGASGTARAPQIPGPGNAVGDPVILTLALLEDSVVALKPQAPTVAWLDKVSSKSMFGAGPVVIAGVAAGLGIAWLVAMGTRGPPALRARRYSLALRAPPLRLS